MLCIVSFFIASGIAIGFFICYGSVKIDSSLSWRLPFAVSALLALLISIGCATPLVAFSPRWLVMKGRRDEAEAVLDLITGMTIEHVTERRELLEMGASETKSTFMDIFSKGVRGRTFLGAFLNVFQQLTGISHV